MTEDEVVEILGGPGISCWEAVVQYHRLEKELGKFPYEFEDPSLSEPANGAVGVGDWDKIWTGRRGIIEIRFDRDKHVCWKKFHGVRWINRGVLERLRDWLGW
jgi:hypothetical protein